MGEVEEWKELPNHDELEANALGVIRRKDTKELLEKVGKTLPFRLKYTNKENKRITLASHIEIARLFLDNPNNYKYVKFKDGDKRNIQADNLYWARLTTSNVEEPVIEMPASMYKDLDKWKIVDFNENLIINSDGKIIWIGSQKPYTAVRLLKGYWVVLIGAGQGARAIHRMVANLFVENPHKYKRVKFLDGDKTNHKASNLQWSP